MRPGYALMSPTRCDAEMSSRLIYARLWLINFPTGTVNAIPSSARADCAEKCRSPECWLISWKLAGSTPRNRSLTAGWWVHYKRQYIIGSGRNFSRVSKNALGFSSGAHGLRHSYTQERMSELRDHGSRERAYALEVVSQEMGHFRPSITETYLC